MQPESEQIDQEDITPPTLRIVNEIEESWTVSRIATERPPASWESLFAEAVEEFKDIDEILANQELQYGKWLPLRAHLFRAFEMTRLEDVKVCLLGQDPYPQTLTTPEGYSKPKAQGLSFSVSRDDSIPSSLQNIYIELANTVPGFIKPHHGDLSCWARQGVLLLNMSLTVQPGQPKSHGIMWLGFIERVFKLLAIKRPQTVYLLLGRQAQLMKEHIDDKSPIIEAVHPSGKSANRGFFGSDVFNKVNAALIKNGQTPINWSVY